MKNSKSKICLFSITDLALCCPHLRCLLPPQCDLRCHDALTLHHQQAAGTATVPPAAEAFVAFQTRNDAVVPTAGAFGAPGHLARFQLMALWRQGHLILSSVPAAAALPSASVRTCHVNNFLNFLGFQHIKFCCGLQLQASFQLRAHLWLRAPESYFYSLMLPTLSRLFTQKMKEDFNS